MAVRCSLRLALETESVPGWISERACDLHDNVLGNVDGKLADTGAAKLLHNPIAAAGQVLFLLVRY